MLSGSPDAVLSKSILARYGDLPLPADKMLATYVWVDGTGEHVRCKDRTLNFTPKVPKDKLTLKIEQLEELALKQFLHEVCGACGVCASCPSCSVGGAADLYSPPFLWPTDVDTAYALPCANCRQSHNNSSTSDSDDRLTELPVWYFDGSSTGQAGGHNSDTFLVPRAVYRDPFRRGHHVLVMCDTYKHNMEPTETNHRVSSQEAYGRCRDEEPWFGIEQEYILLDSDLRPLGWPPGGFPPPQGPYYCGVGADKVVARDLVEAHYRGEMRRCCLFAGVPISATNAEAMPSQWEYKVGPAVGVAAGDDLWMSRYLLHRLAEDYGVTVTFDPKPVNGWSGSGAHTNFSTNKMRDDNGIIEIEKAIDKLSKVHMKHVKVYDPRDGKDNETASIDGFSAGVACRGSSVRIPRAVAEDKRGYLEDRRPASNCDPYSVIDALMRTCILDE